MPDAAAPRRVVLASRRFERDRRSFAAKYPAFDSALRAFARFRVVRANGEAYDAKDGRTTAGMDGLRRWHAVHGKAIVLYDLPPGRLVLLAVVEHDAIERPAALAALCARFAAWGDGDLAPAPLLLADPEIEAAFDAQAAEIARLRSALAREQAEARAARADAEAAWELAQARPPIVPEGARETAERFGPWLRRVRLERGMTQAEVAASAGLSQAAISHYERGAGQPFHEYRARIEAALRADAP